MRSISVASRQRALRRDSMARATRINTVTFRVDSSNFFGH